MFRFPLHEGFSPLDFKDMFVVLNKFLISSQTISQNIRGKWETTLCAAIARKVLRTRPLGRRRFSRRLRCAHDDHAALRSILDQRQDVGAVTAARVLKI